MLLVLVQFIYIYCFIFSPIGIQIWQVGTLNKLHKSYHSMHDVVRKEKYFSIRRSESKICIKSYRDKKMFLLHNEKIQASHVADP